MPETKMRSSATVAAGMSRPGLPYLYSGDVESALKSVAAIGYDAVELLLPGSDFVSAAALRGWLALHKLDLSAIGTGGAYIQHRLHLCSPDEAIRRRAEDYVREVIDLAAPFGAAVILGLVTGFLEQQVKREQALGWLAPALRRLGDYAAERQSRVVIEPLNRYESNLINRVEDGLELLRTANTEGLGLLADLFHMNIEEVSIPDSLRRAGPAIGHVHFVDSNRRAPGMGHTDFTPIAEALREIGYLGCLSVEALPLPDSDSAAETALATFRRLLQ